MTLDLKITQLIIFGFFLTLKLIDAISWSWWWVTSPLWLPFIFACILVFLKGGKITCRGFIK